MELLRLKELLKEKGITSKELAEYVNVTPATISNIIKGKSFPKPELLLDISKALRVDIKELFYPTLKTDTETIYILRDNEYIPIGTINIP